jgi:hypothetical protein
METSKQRAKVRQGPHTFETGWKATNMESENSTFRRLDTSDQILQTMGSRDHGTSWEDDQDIMVAHDEPDQIVQAENGVSGIRIHGQRAERGFACAKGVRSPASLQAEATTTRERSSSALLADLLRQEIEASEKRTHYHLELSRAPTRPSSAIKAGSQSRLNVLN